MKKLLLTTSILVSTLSLSILPMSVQAETTFGVGIGSLYNGFGINVGKTTSTSLTFGSVGCIGWGYGSEGYSSNCGAGFGVVTTAALPGLRHGLGLSLAVTKNTSSYSEVSANVELMLMPSYYYFFSGIEQGGFNLGAGPSFTYQEGQSIEPFFTLNIGYQF